MIQIEEKNGIWYLSDGDFNAKVTDKNSLMKAVAGLVGVSILTSDEVDVDNNSAKMLKDKYISPLEKTEFDSGCITHDGIQFNKHFIDLSRRVDQLEAKLKSHTQKYI